MSTIMGLAWYFPALVFLSLIGLRIFDQDKRFRHRDLLGNIMEMSGILILLLSILGAITIVNTINALGDPGKDYTGVIYQLEGNAHIVWLQSAIQNTLFIHMTSIFYILVFTWLIIFTSFFTVATGRKSVLRLFTYSLVINYMITLPFYLFFNVTVTSMYPVDTPVQGLLYDNDMYRGLIQLVGGYHDCFPSGHISVTTIATLIMFLKTDLKRYAYASLMITILTGFTILYLGIHWFIDIPAGMLVGSFSFIMAQRPFVSQRLDRVVSFIEKRIPGAGPYR